MITEVRLLSETRVEVRVPEELLGHADVKEFQRFLHERGGVSESEAGELTERLLRATVTDIGEGWGAALRPHVTRISEIRTQLKDIWSSVLEHASDPAHPTELGGEVVDRLDALFANLDEELGQMPNLRQYVDTFPRAESVVDLQGLDEAQQTGRGPHEDVEPEKASDVLLDPVQQPREWRPGIHEQQRVELDWYRDALRDNPDPEPRAAAEASLGAFMERFPIPDGWEMNLRRLPEYGFTLEQMQQLASRDPNFAARGFEVVIHVPQGVEPWATGPRGASFAPDGVMQGPRGFLFLEYKTSWAPEPQGFYASEAGRAQLRGDMEARARMSEQISGCDGWGYRTGTPWLDEIVASIKEDMRNTAPELADRIHVLSGGGQ